MVLLYCISIVVGVGVGYMQVMLECTHLVSLLKASLARYVHIIYSEVKAIERVAKQQPNHMRMSSSARIATVGSS
jgi:hypothetical protein